ncbi:hypothetical protein F4820DRAFT_449397 [Hypoxylon rubiginosum]|uniref:Uncharacterized protein n=1 Tax=Hypoxylon rubiginosum TaxID=110542 RepID=A0ACB9YYC7_9PEZI|nr:hypothetical protein F4820DRAFT_449397 [Hypoxylon rubiginosum]
MVQDDNEPPRVRGPPPGATEPPEHVKKPQIYEIFPGSKPEDQAMKSTEGQKSPSQPSITEGIQSIKPDDFLNVHQIPCARQSLLTGIGAGAAVGMGRFVAGGRIPKATNWAFWSFFIGSIAQWEYCRAQRANERAAVARIVQVMDKKQADKKTQVEEVARLKKEQAEEKIKQEAAAKKSWYKFW